jgi:hypothetical protein
LKRFLIVSILALVLVMAMAGSAFASFGPHGSYTTDTDACAGCHRAHTAFSSIARINYATGDASGTGSALLVSSATNMDDFCYACHGAGGPGASTNVELGVFDAGPSADSGSVVNTAAGLLYQTASAFGANLNGGGFAGLGGVAGGITSNHTLDSPGIIWGYGNAATDSKALLSDFNCTSCHDPHGSSNYRLLNDKLLGKNTVGGYTTDTNPTPFVISAEIGYPAGGFSKHTDYMAAGYIPNYTTPQYRFQGDAQKSMSGWCSGCHEQYINNSSAYSYGTSETAKSAGGGTLGSVTRHRHPVNMNLQTGRPESGQMALATAVTTNSALPLEMAFSKDPAVYRTKGSDFNDVVGCLTCHFAHGTSATMTGWANASLDHTMTPVRAGTTATWFPVLDPSKSGVNPNFSSALLRVPNRGVCERCHNK